MVENNTKLRIFAVLFVLFFLAVLGVIKYKTPTFPLIWVIGLGLLLILIGVGIFFASTIFSKFREKDKIIKDLTNLPKPASLGELLTMADQAMTNKYLMNHTKGCEGYWFVTLPTSRNRVFIYKTKALYTKDMKEGQVYIIINSNFPTELRDILVDPEDYELNRKIKEIGNEVEKEPELEETIISNPTLGIQSITKKPIVKEEDKPESEKKEDLE